MLHLEEIDLTNGSYPKSVLYYSDDQHSPKAMLLYFHGGGLLYGDKNDLPEYHIQRLTEAGYGILSYDYPLAPAAKLPMILEDICSSIQQYIANGPLPYYLWGRSAGAYLCLLAAAHGQLAIPPRGILSYYGYGFLCDHWFHTPSPCYQQLPSVPASCLDHIPQDIHTTGDLDTHYSIYVYARQQGCWKQLIYEGREKFFLLQYSLRTCDTLPCPLFCAHSTGDPDVPFEEFSALCQKYNPERYVASGTVHDFDRDTETSVTHALLDATISFLEQHLF